MAVSLSDSPPSQGPSCPVCFRDYSDNEAELIPRILQCGHTYCSECLDRILNTIPDEDEYQQVVLNIRYAGREWTTTRNYPRVYTPASSDIKCPTCKAINPIQNRDIASLTKNFALLGCRTQSFGSSNKTVHFCNDHNHEKRIYCEDCKILICAYCQLYGDHVSHKFMVATEASKPSIESLRQAEETLSKDLENLEEGEIEVSQTIAKMVKTRGKCERNVRRYFGGAVERLKEQRDVLLSQISSWTEEQIFILNAQLDMLVNATKEVKTTQSSCQALVEGDPLDALTEHQDMEEKIALLRSRVSGLSLRPLITPWMKAKEEGPCNVTLSMLMDNFKLTYDTDNSASGGRREGEDAGDRSDSDSESSADSLMGGSGGLPDVLEAYRLRALGLNPDKVNEREKRKKVYSQETQRRTPGEGGAVGLDPVASTLSAEHWVSSVTPGPLSSFSHHQHHRMLHRLGMSASTHLLDDASESNSDAENLLFRQPRTDTFLLERTPNSSNGSQGDLEDSSGVQASSHHLQSHELSSSGGAGVDSVLDSLEIRRHWNFLNRSGIDTSDETGGENNSKEEEEDDEDPELDLSGYHPLSLAYDTEGRSAHSTTSSSQSPPQRNHPRTSSDFAFAHHLSLPVDLRHDPNDEVVFPSSPPYSWGDQINGRHVQSEDYSIQASVSPSHGDGVEEVEDLDFNTETI